MTAKEYLSQYGTLNSEINAKLEQKRQLFELAASVAPSATHGGSGNVSDKVGRTAAKLLDLEREINADIDRLVDLRREIEAVIAGVPDERLRTLLELRYINGVTFERIAEHLDLSAVQIWRLHKIALEAVQEKNHALNKSGKVC